MCGGQQCNRKQTASSCDNQPQNNPTAGSGPSFEHIEQQMDNTEQQEDNGEILMS